MHRITYILILLSFASSFAVAQDKNSFSYYDSLTYKQYTDAEWKSLTSNCKAAIKNGYDYYYMRMRLGISYYERRSYLTALAHFRKALDFSHGDPVALEYIYYCYLFTAKYGNANAVSQKFGPELSKKTAIQQADKNLIYLGYLYNNSYSDSHITNYSTIEGYDQIGNTIVPKTFSYFGLTMNHKLSETVGLFHSLSYLKKSSMLYYNTGIYRYDNFEQNVNQFKYYFSLIITNSSGLRVSPAVAYINTRYPLIGIDTSTMNPRAFSYQISENNLFGGLSISKDLGIIETDINGGLSKLGGIVHVQAGAELIIHPLGNNKLYMGGAYYYRTSRNIHNRQDGNIFKGKFGFSIADKVLVDFVGIFGDLENFADMNGYIIYNSINRIDHIIKSDITIPFGKSGVMMSLGGKYVVEHTAFIPEGFLYSFTDNNSFKSISFIGGLSWTF